MSKTDKILTQRIILQSADHYTFVRKFQELVLAGAVVDENEPVRLRQFPYTVHFLKTGSVTDTTWMIESDSQIKAFTIPVEDFVYDAQDIAVMDWATLKKVVKPLGIGTRNRVQAERAYLRETGQQVYAETGPEIIQEQKAVKAEAKKAAKAVKEDKFTKNEAPQKSAAKKAAKAEEATSKEVVDDKQ